MSFILDIQNKMNELKNQNEQPEIQLSKAYNNCLRFLGPRARSIKETKDYLKRKKFASLTINKTINKLLKEKLLDDRSFACLFVENRERFRPRSKFALSFELKQKGVDEIIIDYAVKDIDDLKSAWTAVKPKLCIWQNLEDQKFKKKIFNYLKNRGFSYEISSAIYAKSCRYLNLCEQD